jgi:hypothetical protein
LNAPVASPTWPCHNEVRERPSFDVLEEPVHERGLRFGSAEPVPLFVTHDGKIHERFFSCAVESGESGDPL